VPGQEARDPSIAAWALVHGLAQLLLGGQIGPGARRGRAAPVFVRDLLSTVRFVARTAAPDQPPA